MDSLDLIFRRKIVYNDRSGCQNDVVAIKQHLLTS